MKKIAIIAITGVLITSCGTPQKPKTIEMTAANLSAAPGGTEIIYQIINPTDSLLEYGAYYNIDYLDSEEWIPMPVNEAAAFIDIMYMLQPKDSSQLYTVTLYPERFDYPAGKYRIRKDIYAGGEKITLTAPFTLEGERSVRPTIQFRVEPNVYDSVPERLTYVITNGMDERIAFGTYFQLDRLVEMEWQKDYITENMLFNDLAIYALPGGSFTGDDIYLPRGAMEYPAGMYRLRKQIMTADGEITVYTGFRIR